MEYFTADAQGRSRYRSYRTNHFFCKPHGKFHMIHAAKSRFLRIKPYLPAICFTGGFTWDNLTLVRVDNRLDMAIFGVYLLLAGVAITLIGRGVRFRFSRHLPLAVQFLFGGLFSSFFVYYFKSASSAPAFFFMAIPLALLVGNEFLEKRLGDIKLAIILYAMASFMYLNVVVPVLLRRMNPLTFILALLCSIGLYTLIRALSGPHKVSIVPTAGLYTFLTLAYFLNIIPPVPLAKKYMGIYRSVERRNGAYCCEYEKPRWYQFGKKREKQYRWAPGDTVFCFSSVFAPTKLRKGIYHHWYTKPENSSQWKETDVMGYTLTGGRDEGYRGYTYKCHVHPGAWKVALKTAEGKTLGIVGFEIVERANADSIATTRIEY
ncbi:MAG: DUF2914 domain-containing protein [Chitinivibrionales bacterium]|nr:DUF2914 domain-containing protein [Chitinivibrionales bacterium]MBD3357165.1 DUF2914 domain-containing protein [Chitinivibrionales bacterium]